MFKKLTISLLCIGAVALTSCNDDEGVDLVSQTFTVKVENVSTPNVISSDRANGNVPLSPGAYAVYSGHNNPLFTVGKAADEGTERIAEDGFPMQEASELQSMADVLSGTFESAGGPDNGPAILPGESTTFTFKAKPGDKLQLATMFVQSNDWFYAFGDKGLDLFEGLTAIDGDVTSKLVLYDAGTEEDTAPGTGPNQKPVQDPMATNVGPDDSVNYIEKAATRHPDYTIPATSSVIRITISHK